MSCQQAPRFITTISGPQSTPEDPYVFTETVPTTPPFSFNAQKSRSKFTTDTAVKRPLTSKTGKTQNKKLPLAQQNGNAGKTQASLRLTSAGIIGGIEINTSAKNVTKSQSQQPQQKKFLAHICPTPPHQPQKSPPLLQHTPSLWQTPLLLDVTTPVVSPPTSPASLPSPTLAQVEAAAFNAIATTLSTPSPPKPVPLPPSNFHHTTLAQHLQKVQCLKTPKKAATAVKQHPEKGSATVAAMPPLQLPNQPQPHSEADLNEIPVNVIFRKPQVTKEITQAACVQAAQSEPSTAPTAAVATIATERNYVDSTNLLGLAPTPSPTHNLGTILPAMSKDVVFVQPNSRQDVCPLKPQSQPNKQEMSSSAVQARITDCIGPGTVSNIPNTNLRAEKVLQTDATMPPANNVSKRKGSAAVPKFSSPIAFKKCRKSTVSADINGNIEYELPFNPETTAVAIVKSSQDADAKQKDLLNSFAKLPYSLMHHWVDTDAASNARFSSCDKNDACEAGVQARREERISQYKFLLQRQAYQLLTTRTLRDSPLKLARQRLSCVDRLLRKHQNLREEDDAKKQKCTSFNCTSEALESAPYCLQHILNNATQSLFVPCTDKRPDGMQCGVPAFDIAHHSPLCVEHARKFDAYVSMIKNEAKKPVQPQQFPLIKVHVVPNRKTYITKAIPVRKRKSVAVNPIGRPRSKKPTISPTTPPPLSAVSKRKNSTTSLESIASNSPSSNSHTQMPPTTLSLPALAPLSNGLGGLLSPRLNFDMSPNLSANVTTADDLKEHEINQIVAQFASVANLTYNNANLNDSSLHNLLNTNSNSNFTSVLGSSSSLPSTDELLTQDMLSICENSSPYASSEDTGFGGLSETELMAGPHDADDIPLGDTRLLEEQDLANVLSTLPVDAFNEIFTAVRQDEREEVERALELADKHLKSLQQTIGSEPDFFGDFLNVNDDILADTDICSKMEIISSCMHSPSTSDIDPATLFMDTMDINSNAGVGSGTPAECPPLTDIRGLLQT